MSCGSTKKKRVVLWPPPSTTVLKSNVDGAARGKGKPSPTGLSGALRDSKGIVSCMFSKSVEIRDSNEAKVMAILEALKLFSQYFQGRPIVESDSYNAI